MICFTHRLLAVLVLISALILQPSVFAQETKASPGWLDKSYFEARNEYRDFWKNKNVDEEELEGSGYEQFKRYEWFWSTRVDASGRYNSDLLMQGLKEKYRSFPNSYFASRQKGALSKTSSSSSNWTNLGPQTSIPTNGGAGRVNCIVFDPTNSNTIYIGAPAGGLWKSNDGGTTWSSNTDELPNSIGVSALAIDPTNTNVMYLGTGDRDAGDTYGVGILKTTDGGNTWNPTGLSFTTDQFYRISKIVLHPANSNTVIAAVRTPSATVNGIYKSLDGGTTWTGKVAGKFYDLLVDPSNSSIWYAAGYNESVGVWKSADAGETWTKLAGGLPTSGTFRAAITLSGSTIYALFCNNTDYGYVGTYKSTNGGSTWTKTDKGSLNLLGWNTNGRDAGGQGWYDLSIAASPTDPNTVYIGGVNIWKSGNGGGNWSNVSYWAASPTAANYVHADQHMLVFLPGSGTTVFSGNDGGFFKTTDGAASWTDKSNGLGIHQYYKISGSVTNANIVYGGAQDNGTDRYNAGTWTRVVGGDGMNCEVDYSNDQVVYAEYYNGNLVKSTNGGGSFSDITQPSEGGTWVTPYVLHPSSPSTIYYAGVTKVWQSTSGGSSWTAISAALGNSTNNLSAIAVAPTNGSVVYTASAVGMWKTTNVTSWSPLTSAPLGITHIAVSPNDANTVYVTIGGYTAGNKVYKSVDGGSTWSNVSGTLPNIPANCIAVHPNSASDLYLGTDLGVFYSNDAGSTWQAFDTGLPNVIVDDLDINVLSGKIRAATFGRGLWESPLQGVVVSNSVTVNTPNGGESWATGSIHNITWSSTGTIANVTLEYSLDAGSNWTIISSSTANDGSEAWTLPGTTSTTARVRVSDAANAATNDISNANFTIVDASIATVTVSSPNGGENWATNSSHPITWASTGTISNVKLEYSLDGGSNWTVITSSTANDGSEAWTVPNSPTLTARVRVSDASNSATNDISNANFTISAPSNYITSETEPNGSSSTANGPVGSGVSVSGAISANKEEDWFYLDVTTAGTVNISLAITTAGKDLDWFLYNSALTEVARGYTTSNPETGSYNAATGHYYLRVKGYTNNTGSYVLSVNGGLAIKNNLLAGNTTPGKMALEQNYPNPFNPSTSIRFSLPNDEFVTLRIYNVLGHEIRTLVNEKRTAGSYQVVWDGLNKFGHQASTGLYIYRLQVGNEVISRKMNFIK